jgi:hypothetical protein
MRSLVVIVAICDFVGCFRYRLTTNLQPLAARRRYLVAYTVAHLGGYPIRAHCTKPPNGTPYCAKLKTVSSSALTMLGTILAFDEARRSQFTPFAIPKSFSDSWPLVYNYGEIKSMLLLKKKEFISWSASVIPYGAEWLAVTITP